MIGQTISHYRIVEKIGSGGMGAVYRAHDESLDRDVALKVLPEGSLSDETARKRFKKEALALSKLNHPNIATVHQFGQQDGVDFLVMEHVAGVKVADKLAQGPLPEKEVAHLGQQLADGLVAAHEQGLIHRDLKPGNLRLTADGRLKILDFGLAKLLRPTSGEDVTVDTITRTQDMAGTMPYMAPEQLRGEPSDARTDIYAAGVVLYEMTTGRLPFEAKLATALAADIQHKGPIPPRQLNPRISTRLEEIILKCLDKEPDRRYHTAKELLVDLRRLAAPTAAAVVAHAHLSRRRLVVPAAGVVLLIVAIGFVGLNVAGLRDHLLGRPPAGRIRSIAVLPFENLSHDTAQDYLAEGIQEELITDLTKLSGLKRVIARNSVMQYKATSKPLREIARELDVDALITGTVLPAQNRVRITAHLIEGATEKHLWADHYERDLRDVIPLQNEIVETIASQIQLQLTPQEQTRLATTHTVNPSAHEAYLRGRYYLDLRTKEGFDKALTYFQQAIEFDATYAPAYASLSDVYRTLQLYNPDKETELVAKARAATLKALELDDQLPAAHYNLAGFRLLDLDWSGAEGELRRAIELDPNNASAHEAYASLLLPEGRLAEAQAEIQRAQELDPLSFEINQAAVLYLYYARRYNEFIKGCQRWVERDPQQGWRYHQCLGAAYIQMGKQEEAIAELREALKSSPAFAFTATDLANALAVAGKRQEALKLLDQVNNPPWKAFGAALVYVGLGEKDEAFRWLRKAIDLRAPWVYVLKVDPRFDSLRQDPRFADLLRRMGLPQ